MIKNDNIQHIQHNKREGHQIRRLETLSESILNAYKDRFGEVYVGILYHWPSIVGKEKSLKLKVMSLKYVKTPTESSRGVLSLSCKSALLPLMQMQGRQIIELINGYFGYSAIQEIRFQAVAPLPKAKPELPISELPEVCKQEIEGLTQSIENEILRKALRNFGESVYKKDKKNNAY